MASAAAGAGGFPGHHGLLLRGGGPGWKGVWIWQPDREWEVREVVVSRCLHVKAQGSARSQFRGPQTVPAANLVSRHVIAIGDKIHGVSRAHAVVDEPVGNRFSNPHQGCFIARRHGNHQVRALLQRSARR